MQGTFTAKLDTVKHDGSPHVVPNWFVLDDDGRNKRRIWDIVFMTYKSSVEARTIQNDNRVSICVDDQIAQYFFVTIHGTARIYHLKQCNSTAFVRCVKQAKHHPRIHIVESIKCLNSILSRFPIHNS